MEDREYNSIVTHFDLDGVASAAICDLIYEVDRISFAGPSNMDRLSYDESTIVTDLPNPFPKECGLWYDHHMANLDDLKGCGGDISTINAVVEHKPSCLRVIFDELSKDYELDEWLPFVEEVDTIDGFLFKSYQEWLEVTPAKDIDHAIKNDYNDFNFMRKLVHELRDSDYIEVSKLPEVQKRALEFRRRGESQLPLIEKVSRKLDTNGDIILLDLTSVKNPQNFEKNYVYNFFPEAKAAITVRSIYRRGVKTNGLSFSISLGFVEESIKEKIDVGSMMRELEIGNGHPGAAAGRFDCKSKDERLKREDEVLTTIKEMWSNQLKG